ncbi:nucleotide-diphospho-sugar transferase-domain-containing protein [Phascolomyces articulosus]|uniref:Nucleotide-diphospho-sugar transferase-domain-containing protein n=1 Tax=Phascolomyces articulosus TaxID=60185 RepID=A0AAD5KJZ9_9FUNG|nr:nucleotide-diphospho-sugar transferase-domain-containing protein [Phascolomyces articulosus]
MVDWLPKRRVLVSLVGVFFLISVLALLTNLFPVQTNLITDDQPSSSVTGTFDAIDHTKDTDSDEPEQEDLVQVNTKPTDADKWEPKTFEPLEGAMMKIINNNIRKEKKDKILLTAVVNAGMAEYTLNWIESLKRTNQDAKYLVFAIDKELYDILVDHGYSDHVVQIPEDWFHQKLSSGFAKWLDKSYTPITHAKTLVVERLLYADITVWFSDVDIVFTNAHIYDYLLMKLNSRKSLTEFLTTQETEQKIINSGFYIMRPTLTNKRILSDSIVIQDNEPKVTQQRAMNRVIDEMNLSYQTSPMALLDLALFPHGRLYFERAQSTKYGIEPMMVHANYRVGEEKKKSLQGANLWYLDE